MRASPATPTAPCTSWTAASWRRRSRRCPDGGVMIRLRNIEKHFEHGVQKTFILRRVNLDVKAGEFVSIMGPSGGQQQLVAVARAVIAGPSLILADEPTGNLHTSQGREIMELFKKLNGAGATIVQVTHSEVNASYGHRVIQIRDGWIQGEGTS